MTWWAPAAAVMGAGFIRLVGCTWRIAQDRSEIFNTAREHSDNLIFTFWHGRLLPLSWAYRNRNIQVLASEHRDGDLLARTIRLLGFGNVRGSSTRGGTRAIREMVQAIGDGYDVGITVDGPVGPRYVVKPGPIEVARQSGAAIVPVTTGSVRHKTFNSWDAFELPAPFTRVRIGFGEPVIVPPDAGEELFELKRQELENSLRAITEEIDGRVARK